MNMTFFEDENLVTYNFQQENKIKYYKLIVSTTAASQVFTKLRISYDWMLDEMFILKNNFVSTNGRALIAM